MALGLDQEMHLASQTTRLFNLVTFLCLGSGQEQSWLVRTEEQIRPDSLRTEQNGRTNYPL